jgi:uncharacterized protein YqgC (DUF456 family)
MRRRRANYGLFGAFAGLLIVYISENILPERRLGSSLIIVPLIGAIMGTIVERISHRTA